MKNVYPRARSALSAVSRSDFITNHDLSSSISGHTIPREEVVAHLLSMTPEIMPEDVVMNIGGGSGYLAAVLSKLSRHVIYVEQNPDIAEVAKERFLRLGLNNIEVLAQPAESLLKLNQPCDLLLSVIFMPELAIFLREGGSLICLEDRSSSDSAVTMYVKNGDKLELGHTLGWLDFNRNSEQILIDMGMVDKDILAKAKSQAATENCRVLDILNRNMHVEEMELYHSLAQRRNMKLVKADELLPSLTVELFRHFSRTFMDLNRLIPVAQDNGKLIFVTDDPDVRTDMVKRLSPNHTIECWLVIPTDFRRIWSALDLSAKGNRFAIDQAMSANSQSSEPLSKPETEDIEDDHVSPYLVSVYEAILIEAVSNRASDIHIEQYGKRVRIRLRVDGDLRDLHQYKLTHRELKGVINIIKLRAELDIAERRLPQGGRSRLQLRDMAYDLRVQTQPSLHGEHVIIRLLPQTGRAMTITELGMSPMIGSHYERLLDNPAGLVLVVGPTGSGKSTTLYAGLQTLADDGRRKVITVEDPIEYSIDNIQQTPVRNDIGFNFAAAMRSFVRQDPDVIMIGEIRDKETALEAIRASQTGHIVLSTLHSNDAVDSLQRLYDLGIQPNSIAGELLAVIAQRLAKRICKHCRQPAIADPVILEELFPHGAPDNFRCFEGKGCDNCGGHGTHGRVAIVEYMEVDSDIRNAISSQPPIGELRWRALDSGLIAMRDSALDHVIEGIIPMSELPRILPKERMAPEVRGGRRSSV
ncbi:MAG: ATPase, T2SS/T4P/T4SS family [Pseudomonas sp.]|jgi:type IV pilus assembly protein PilB|nr:ATPase, T2SS/T4P/T4SS family [Pseudomonas sp.]